MLRTNVNTIVTLTISTKKMKIKVAILAPPKAFLRVVSIRSSSLCNFTCLPNWKQLVMRACSCKRLRLSTNQRNRL